MCKVLVVDDDAALRESLEAVLIAHGHDVSSAQDGLAALRAAMEMKPDVIISDVNMPQLEGPDAVRILKALPRFRRVPVILMSGAELPDTGLVQVALRKPVIAERLLELVEDLSRSIACPSRPSANSPPILASAQDAGWNLTLAVASLGPSSSTECAVRICRGIELMHSQAARIGRGAGMNSEESERLYNCLVESIASLVQCLPATASAPGGRGG
jgi:CheY-like chemotaxis protein